MLRAVLLGAISFSVVSACGSKTDAPAAQPGAVAGTVLEVTGAVKVGATPLAVGSTVKTDDVIETGPDGNVVIELAHNQARWELGPNSKKKPTESLAWSAAKAAGSAAPTAEQTSAAGRPAERSAADSTSSTPKTLPVAPSEASSGSPAPPAPTRAEPTQGIMSRPPSPTEQAGPGGADGGGGPSHGARTMPKPSADPGTESTGAVELAHSKDKKPSADAIESLASCLPIGMTVTLKAHVANHVPAITFTGTVDRAVAACITTAAKQLSLSVETGDLVVTLTK
jgi:hypothetical protein